MNERFFFDGVERSTLTIASKTVALVVEQGVSVAAQQLIWNEFFASRGRGADWATHLPWSENSQTLCVSATVSEPEASVVAALVIRCVPDTSTALIGYVCVDPAFRQHGLSGHLLNLAAVTLRGRGLDRMLLWTGKPSVYERRGFVIIGHERRVTMRGAAAGPAGSVTLTPWPTSNDDKKIGLPPFATSGWRAASPDAHIVFVDTPMGATLLDQSGAPQAVVRVMSAARPGDWSATLVRDHPLLRYAETNGMSVENTPGPVTMYRALGENRSPPSFVPPLFRI